MTNPESSPQSGSLPSYEAGSEFETLPAEASTGIVTQETDEDITNARVLLNGPEGHQKELPASRSRKRPAPGDIEIATKWMRWKESTSKELEDLDEAAKLYSIPIPEDYDGCRDDKCSDDDKRFMEETRKVAQNSPDPNTKVGAVIVNPKTKKIVATGWNRMPEGCEERFKHKWSEDYNKDGRKKQYYVVFAARAAIFDGLKKGEDLEGCTMYTTLNPSNVCAQCIRDVGITEVVYSSDKFRDAKFMVASRRILEGIKCRKMK